MKQNIHKLRQIAQSKGVKFSFSDDALALSQKITMLDDALESKKPEAPVIVLNHIMANQAPNEAEIREMLASHVQRGMKLRIEGDSWHMSYANIHDTGTMHQPAINILRAAEKVMG